jgi:hypothetical protein
VTKLDWEKAKPKPAPEPRRESPKSAALRQTAMANYVSQHGLTCFKCGTPKAEWAKTGRGKHGPWAICVNCVRG